MDNTLVNFQIDNIEINRIAISQQPSKFDPEHYNYNLKVEHRFNLEEEIVAVITTAQIFTGKKDKLAEIEINVFYKVENLKNFENKKDKKMELPADFITAINSVSISTLRGVMFSQLRGTYLHNAFLPVINPKSLNADS